MDLDTSYALIKYQIILLLLNMKPKAKAAVTNNRGRLKEPSGIEK